MSDAVVTVPTSEISSGGRVVRCLPALLALVAVAAFGQQTVDVSIQEYRFQPAEVRIKVGDTVRWVNRENRTSHSVLFPAENGLESERLFPGEHWQRAFVQPGRYSYRCGPHEEMKGVVVVE